MIRYQIIYRDPFGVLMDIIEVNSTINLEFTRKENDYGSLYLDLPPIYEMKHFVIDGILEVWKSVDGGTFSLDGETVWFIRLVRMKTDESGKRYLHILAYDAVQLIDRRIIAYFSGTTYTSKTDYADNMIKALIRENMGNLATDTARDLSAYLSVESDHSLGPNISRSFPHRKLLATIQDIANDSKASGTYLAFDVVALKRSSSSKVFLEFRTYTNQRGYNRGKTTKNPFYISFDRKNLSYASLVFDHMDEVTYVYSGGLGEEEERTIGTAYDANRIATSPFNRIEDFIDAKSTDDQNSLDAEARTRLLEMSPRIGLNGHICDTENSIFGRDFDFGDIVVATYNGFSVDVHLDTYNVQVKDGIVSRTVYAKNLEDSDY